MAEHPLTPPPELVEELQDLGNLDAIRLAFQAGADQELEACCKTLQDIWDNEDLVTLSDVLRWLRAARRPKPPSLKEQALEAQRRMWSGASNHDDWDLVRRALEQLND